VFEFEKTELVAAICHVEMQRKSDPMSNDFDKRNPKQVRTCSSDMKYLLKQSIRYLLPSENFHASKRELVIPMSFWLRTFLRFLTERLLAPERLCSGEFGTRFFITVLYVLTWKRGPIILVKSGPRSCSNCGILFLSKIGKQNCRVRR